MLTHINGKGKIHYSNGKVEDMTVTEIYTEAYKKEIYFHTSCEEFVYVEAMHIPSISVPCAASKQCQFYKIKGEQLNGDLLTVLCSDIKEISYLEHMQK